MWRAASLSLLVRLHVPKQVRHECKDTALHDWKQLGTGASCALQGWQPETRTYNTAIIACNMCNHSEEALQVSCVQLSFAKCTSIVSCPPPPVLSLAPAASLFPHNCPCAATCNFCAATCNFCAANCNFCAADCNFCSTVCHLAMLSCCVQHVVSSTVANETSSLMHARA